MDVPRENVHGDIPGVTEWWWSPSGTACVAVRMMTARAFMGDSMGEQGPDKGKVEVGNGPDDANQEAEVPWGEAGSP
jgi:hypothetical protein